VNVVLHGGKRNQVTVTTAQADKGASASITVPDEQKESGWTKTQTIWTVIGVIVAIIGLCGLFKTLEPQVCDLRRCTCEAGVLNNTLYVAYLQLKH